MFLKRTCVDTFDVYVVLVGSVGNRSGHFKGKEKEGNDGG